MFLLEEFEARLRRAGFGDLLRRKESGDVPKGKVRDLSLEEVESDVVGAQTDDFERSIYRVGSGLALSRDTELLFAVSVEWRVYDLDDLCGVHVGKLEAKESVTFDALLCRAGSLVRHIYLEGTSYQACEAMRRERHQSMECIDRFVNLYRRAYETLRA